MNLFRDARCELRLIPHMAAECGNGRISQRTNTHPPPRSLSENFAGRHSRFRPDPRSRTKPFDPSEANRLGLTILFRKIAPSLAKCRVGNGEICVILETGGPS